MSERPVVRGLLVAHGTFAEGMADAVARIAGLEPGALSTLSNTGLSPEALAREIAAVLDDGPWIVFTDMPVGSCAFTARRLCHGRRDVAVVTGVNLPMLLDFVVNRSMPLRELTSRLVEKGHQAILCSPDAEKGTEDAGRAVPRG